MEEKQLIKLSRRQFMAVYRAASELTLLDEQEARKKVGCSPDVSIVDITYSLWQLYKFAGGSFRRLESRK